MLEMMSVAIPSLSAPLIILRPSGSDREIFRRYTPVKITKKPLRRDNVLTASEVLKPPYKMKEAHRVAVVKVT
jgi:hypothetical protein